MICSGNSGAIESAVLVVTASTSHCLEIPKRRNQRPSAGETPCLKLEKSNSRYFEFSTVDFRAIALGGSITLHEVAELIAFGRAGQGTLKPRHSLHFPLQQHVPLY